MTKDEQQSGFLLYNSPDGDVRIEVALEGETVWLTQKAMAELFGVVKSTISEHLSNIFETGELDREATVRNFRTVQKEGERSVTRNLKYYNLDAIISVGYRLNSIQATHFRKWADAEKPNMGLTTWKRAPKGKVLKSDISTAKNYLNEKELKSLNRIVTMYLDYAESQAERQNAMTMEDWIEKLDGFLEFNDYEILQDAGKVSAKVAKKLADEEYEKFRPIQDQAFESDFDKLVEETKKKKSE